jgi:8-oxo-dGTP diphosphatase
MANPKAVAGVVLRDSEGRYLLVQERQARAYGLWNLPAGHVDAGETVQEAALREAYEETGLVVELLDNEPLFIEANNEYAFYAFRGGVTGGDLTFPPEEILDACWLSMDEIEKLNASGKIRSPWIYNAIKKVENNANSRH